MADSLSDRFGDHREGDEEDPRPWEQRGNFRRDVEPYRGYAAHTLAWFGAACSVLGLLLLPLFFAGMILTSVGLLISVFACQFARRDIKRMHQSLLDPTAVDSAQSVLLLARGAVAANLIVLVLGALLIVAFVVWVSS